MSENLHPHRNQEGPFGMILIQSNPLPSRNLICPYCGTLGLAEVIHETTVKHAVIRIQEDGRISYLESNDSKLANGQIDHYICNQCHAVLKDDSGKTVSGRRELYYLMNKVYENSISVNEAKDNLSRTIQGLFEMYAEAKGTEIAGMTGTNLIKRRLLNDFYLLLEETVSISISSA